MQLEFVPQRIVAGLVAVHERAADLHEMQTSQTQRSTLNEIARCLEELTEYRNSRLDRDQWLTVAEIAEATSWTPQWITRLCKRQIFIARQESPGGKWLIRRSSFERWLSIYRSQPHNGTRTR